MFKIEDSIGDVVYISFRDFERYRDIGISSNSGHYFLRGFDNLGIWLEHPGIILAKTEDEKLQYQKNIANELLLKRQSFDYAFKKEEEEEDTKPIQMNIFFRENWFPVRN